MKWEGTFGPGFIVSTIMFLTMIGGGLFAMGEFKAVSDENTKTSAEFRAYKEATLIQMARIETTLNLLTAGGKRQRETR